jgi:hypothetical protein
MVNPASVNLWLPEFYRRAMAVKGEVFDESMVFTRVATSNYWDGYRSQPIIHYTEVGNEHASLVKNDGVIGELLKVLDTSPYPLDMSDVKDKGKYYCVPDLVMIDTNNKFLHVDRLAMEPSATLRRFLFIGMSVLSDFRVQGGVSIDVAKSLAAGGNIKDRYRWTVTEVVPTVSGYNERTLLNTSSIDEMFDFFETHLSEHYEKMEAVLASMNADEKVDDDAVAAESGAFFRRGGNVVSAYVQWFWNVCASLLWYVLLCTCDFMIRRMTRGATLDMFSRRMIGWRIAILCSLFGLLIYLFPFLILFVVLGLGGSMSLVFNGNFLTLLFGYVINPSKIQQDKDDLSSHLCYMILGDKYNYFVNNKWKIAATFFGTVMASGLLYRWLKSYSEETYESESSEFVHASKYNDFINEQEDRMECDRSRVRVKTKAHPGWNVVHKNIKQPLHKGGVDQLYDSVARAILYAKVVLEDGTEIPTHIFGLERSFAVINKHALVGRDCAELVVFRSGEVSGNGITIKLDPSTYVQLGDDLLVFYTYGKFSFKNNVKHILNGNDMVNACEGVFDGHPVKVEALDRSITVDDKRIGPYTLRRVYHYKKNFRPAMCGIPLVAKVGHSGSAIVGIHSAGISTSTTRLAQAIFKDEVVDAVAQLEKRLCTMVAYSESGWDFEVKMPSSKSPVTYEKFEVIRYCGAHPSPVMMNNKSSMLRTKLAPHLNDLFRTHLNFTRDECYSRPPMKPFMRNGEYYSMWNIALRKMDKDPPCLDQSILSKCIPSLLIE